MFECRACVLRSIRALANEAHPTRSLQRPLVLTPNLANRPLPLRRAASTAAATPDASDIPPESHALARKPDGKYRPDAPPKEKAVAIANEKALKTELRYLADPLKLADHVHYTLRDNKPDKALDLCRLASKSMQCVVSWNHVINWHMSKLKVNDAIKIYNEMKKRAQFPDSYTYMLLLRGLAIRTELGQVVREENVSRAVSIYNSMSSPSSRVKPSIIHTNAVLKVCSLALDMDALWGVASKIPDKGVGSADHLTYSIILNAIRHGAFGRNPENVSLEQIAARRLKAVNEARRVWQDVIQKWRAGAIQIDEELVCAMGRVLLLSKRASDWDAVLDLVKQTMNIDRLVAPIGSPDRNTQHVPQEDENPNPAEPEDSEGYTDTPAAKAFKPVHPLPPSATGQKRPQQSLAYVQPGNDVLSLLIEACALMREPKTATAYWDALINDHGVKPDLANFHSQLRLLGKSRASAQAARILRDQLPAAGVTPRNATFRIAMSVCVRDKKNHNVLEHASTIIDVMAQQAADPDVQTLVNYLTLALATDSGPKIVTALNRLDPIVQNLKSRVSFGSDREGLSPESHLVDKEETVLFFQTLVGAIDTLMNRGLVPREEYTHWHGRRSMLDSFIGRAQGRLRRTRDRLEDVKGGNGNGERVVKRGEGKAGLVMSKAAWQARQYRYKDVEKRKAEGRMEKVPGRLNEARTTTTPAYSSGENTGFADSPAEFGMLPEKPSLVRNYLSKQGRGESVSVSG